jgi:hypothetical protein
MKDDKVSLRLPVIERFGWSPMRVGAVLLSLLLSAIHGYADDDSCAMLSHDAGCSSATSMEIHPPLERQW